jgi:LmbE family N-acetylglucosaminyl deacetylase
MNRRAFLQTALAAGVPVALSARQTAQQPPSLYPFDAHPPLVIERPRSGKPRAGQVVAAIQPHADDIPLFAAGTLFKLMDEGAKAYLIRVTNDDMAGPGSYAETVSANARDMKAISTVLGVERTFDLNYNNHMMDTIARSELRARFIFLFRLLKADIVVTYDPWGEYEENPDHYVTSACVEAAAWMAGGAKDYPEHFAAGLSPHSVQGKVLLRAIPAARESRRGYCALGRAQDRCEPGEQGPGTGRGARPGPTGAPGSAGPAPSSPGPRRCLRQSQLHPRVRAAARS